MSAQFYPFNRTAVCIALAALLSACRGSSPTLPATSQLPDIGDRAAGSASFVISDYFPKASVRRPHYFPAETQHLLIVIGGRVTQVDLTPLSSQCQLGGTSIKCTIKVSTQQGHVSYTVTALDSNGARLSTAAGSANIGTNTTIPLTLEGIPARATVSIESAPILGKRSTIGLSISAYDADGALIVGSAPYAKSIQLHNSDNSGVFRLSTGAVSGPKSSIALRYNGGIADTTLTVKPSGTAQKAVVAVYPEIDAKTYRVGKSRFPGGAFLVPGTLTQGTHGDMAVAYEYGFATISPAGKVSHHSSHLAVNALTAGPDGAYWLGRSKCEFPASDCKVSYVSRYDGSYSNYAVANAVTSIVSGPGGKLWAYSSNPEAIFAVDVNGTVQTYAVPQTLSLRTSNIVAPADGNVWLYDRGGEVLNNYDRFVVVAPDGTTTQIRVNNGSDAGFLALSPDKKTIWVPESFYGGIGKMNVITRTFQKIPNVPIQFTGNVIPTAAGAQGVWLQVQRPRYSSPKDPFLGFLRPDGTLVYVEVRSSKDITEIGSLCFSADGTLWFATDTAVGTISLGK